MELHRSFLIVRTLLCIGAALGEQDQEQSILNEMSSSLFLSNQKEAVTALDDSKMTQLTDSIEGLFETKSALRHQAAVKHEASSDMSSASFLVNQKVVGGGLDDSKMLQLTDSIQGLFDAKSVALAASLESKFADPKIKKAESLPPLPKLVVKPSSKKFIFVQMPATDRSQPKARKVGKVLRKQVAPSIALEADKEASRHAAHAALLQFVNVKQQKARAQQEVALEGDTQAFSKAAKAGFRQFAADEKRAKQEMALEADTEAFSKAAQSGLVRFVADAKREQQEMALESDAESFSKAAQAGLLQLVAAAKRAQQEVAPKTDTEASSTAAKTGLLQFVADANRKKEEFLEQEVAQLKRQLAQARITHKETVKPAKSGNTNSRRDGVKAPQAFRTASKFAALDPLVTGRARVESPAVALSFRAESQPPVREALVAERTDAGTFEADASVSTLSQPPARVAAIPVAEASAITESQATANPSRTWWSPVMQWVSPLLSHVGIAAEATKNKGLTFLSTWGQLAQKAATIRSEDKSEVEQAKKLEPAQTHTQDEFHSNHDTGADVSSYWGSLEEQDGDS